MTHEEPELLTDSRHFTTLFYVILRRQSSEWLESSIESDLDMQLNAALTKTFVILLSSNTVSTVRSGH